MKKIISNLKRLGKYITPYKGYFILSLLLTVIAVAANSLIPFIIGLAVTEMASNVADMLKGIEGAGVNFPYVGKIIIITLVIGLLNQLATYFSSFFMTNVVQGSMKDLRTDIDEKINRLPISYFDRNQQGNILSRITNDVDTISNALQQSLIQVVTSILGIILSLIMMLILSVPMTLIAVLIIPLSIIISKVIIKKSQKYFKEQQNSLGNLNGYVQEAYTGFSVIKLYNKENDTLEEFKNINHRLAGFSFKALFSSALINPLVGLVVNLSYTSMAVLGSYFVIFGTMTIGGLQAFIQYIWLINQPISQITQLTGIIQSSGAASERVFEILDEEEEAPEPENALFPEKVEGNISFENVYFSYNKENELIKDLSFQVKSGQTVAIVGPTGAGKTTLINLLMRFYDIDSGSIKIDGVDTRDMKRSDVRSLFGMVLQDAWLYHASISENIRFGKLDATEYEVVDAAKTANVHHFIRTLPNGYEMVLNKEASNISQGQKQLLTIARVVIADPKFLILDEATSSVDTRLEVLIQKAMKKVMNGRTSFVIAHRLSTIRDADLILVMNQGQIVEQGTHETLLANNGLYEKLYNSQFEEDD